MSHQGEPQPGGPKVLPVPPVVQCSTAPVLSSFRPLTVEQITKCIRECPSKSCESGPMPTVLLKDSSQQIHHQRSIS